MYPIYALRYNDTIGKGSISIDGGNIHCRSKYEHYRIKIDNVTSIALWGYSFWSHIEMALIFVEKEENRQISLEYHKKKYVPIDFKNFESVVNLLEKEFQIDRAVFDRVQREPRLMQTILWQRKRLSNIRILPIYPDDIHLGFELVETNDFVEWGTSMSELIRNRPFILTKGYSKVQFNCSVRFGNIVVIKPLIEYQSNSVEMVLYGRQEKNNAATILRQAIADLITKRGPGNIQSESIYFYKSVTIRIIHPHGQSFMSSPDFSLDEDEVDFSIEYIHAG